MSSAVLLLSEDQFLCYICLDVLTDPVTLQCGHNFCNKCITEHWNTKAQYDCPACKQVFQQRPQLKVNTLISEMVAQFRHEAEQKTSSSNSEQDIITPGEVLCDVCTVTKKKALKSCLVCLATYCETHLEPHLTAPCLKRHQLIHPVENLEDRVCKKHEKPLELFCKTDQTCVCMLCPVLDHKDHQFVPLKEEYEGKKEELMETEAELQQMIQFRRVKIEETKHSVKMNKDEADTEKAEGVQVFTALKESVDRGLNKLIKEIEDKQRKAAKEAEDTITELEHEISELMKRSIKVEHVSLSEDHLHFLQSFTSLKTAPPTKDCKEVRVCPPSSYEGTVVRALAQLEENLREKAKALKQSEVKRVQQFAVDVTVDPDTAHNELVLSDDGKQLYHSGEKKNLPDNPKRFSQCTCALGKQSFSTGRFYFEVQVKGKTDWDLGVARSSINRKGQITPRPQTGYWSIMLRNGNEYSAFASPSVRLSLTSQPENVGVFVDYDRGLVSFYDVDAAALIYSFTGCSFTENLHPYFSTDVKYGGKNSAPLIIINHVP
uniref:nuclear factor 7, ovary-like n=1 Tax=Solea senegalensis TaxID=28829 RepID=UPI001CD87AC0|nr:nuclear factor 7, ovary-like [Solea senegalensis]